MSQGIARLREGINDLAKQLKEVRMQACNPKTREVEAVESGTQ